MDENNHCVLCHDSVGLIGFCGVSLSLHMTLAGTAVILGHNWAGTSKVAHSCVWHLDGIFGRLVQLRQLGLFLSV